ncbi:XTP/dITP diphosphatase [Sporolactobacillus sp. Y61]|uniref:dITP/XTP pyrophosphatase n=1 Tax=Sporolactobacillus sp. Y61 TaxID=3160863 RepID=A0AAU8IF42_9BACL
MTRILIASNNQGKIKEIKKILADFDVDVFSLKDLNVTIDVPETGKTFRDNAALKAETLSQKMNLPALADDSGLCVDALGGEPGIFSARYAGPDKNSEHNIDKLLNHLKGVPVEKRTAHFTCVLALSLPGRKTHFAEGHCSGVITDKRRGADGFGYDPVFFVPEEQMTFAEMGEDVKNRISHRAKALQELKAKWTEWMGAGQ